mgnify:CR=1 FL=1
MVLAAAALWGTTGTAQTFVSDGLSSGWFGALRLAVASAFFAVYASAERYRRQDHALDDRLSPGGVIGAGLCMAVYNLAFFAGIRHTGIAVGTAVALGSGPLWAGIVQSLVARQVPATSWWAGTGIGVFGGVLMTVLLVAHGTRKPGGITMIDELAEQVSQTLGRPIRVAFVDVAAGLSPQHLSALEQLIAAKRRQR